MVSIFVCFKNFTPTLQTVTQTPMVHNIYTSTEFSQSEKTTEKGTFCVANFCTYHFTAYLELHHSL